MILLGIASLGLSVIALVVGIAGGVAAVAGAVTSGPVALSSPSATIDARGGEMYILYLPEGSATTCTASGDSEGAVEVVPTSGTAPLGPGGQVYEQKLGIWAQRDTTVTVRCDGPDAVRMGPVDPLRMLLPIGIGALVGTLLGVLGLILLITGIVRRVRSGRA